VNTIAIAGSREAVSVCFTRSAAGGPEGRAAESGEPPQPDPVIGGGLEYDGAAGMVVVGALARAAPTPTASARGVPQKAQNFAAGASGSLQVAQVLDMEGSSRG
jgi:hypothetical protein